MLPLTLLLAALVLLTSWDAAEVEENHQSIPLEPYDPDTSSRK
jgi:hypothetical protein